MLYSSVQEIRSVEKVAKAGLCSKAPVDGKSLDKPVRLLKNSGQSMAKV